MTTLVQKSTVAKFASALTASPSLTSVTAGNTLILLATHYNASNNGGGVTASDGQGGYTNDEEIAGSRYSCDVLRLYNASAGTHSVTVTANAGTSGYGQCILTEWSGLTGSFVDQGNGNSNTSSTGPVSTGASGTLATSSDVVITLSMLAATNTGWGTPSGYTSIYQDLTGSELATSMAYLVLSNNAAVTSNFGTLGTAGQWVAAQAAYTPATSTGNNSAFMMMGMS